MFRSIYRDFKNQINFGNNVTKLIVINVIVFISLYILFAFIGLFAGPDYKAVQDTVMKFLSVPSDPYELLKKPWTIITHMFLHRGLMHFVWNMLLLYWFGRIFGDLMGDRRVIPLYLLAGLVGAMFYFIGVNMILPGGGTAHGASAAVLGILIATAYVAPDYMIHMILLGPVKLKWIALAAIVLDLIGIANLSNTGGHFGHFGGMFMGWLFISLVNGGNDPSPWFNRVFEWWKNLFTGQAQKPKSPLKVRHKAVVSGTRKRTSSSSWKSSMKTSDNQDKLDVILDKISKKGIDSLTKEEKAFLDSVSKK